MACGVRCVGCTASTIQLLLLFSWAVLLNRNTRTRAATIRICTSHPCGPDSFFHCFAQTQFSLQIADMTSLRVASTVEEQTSACDINIRISQQSQYPVGLPGNEDIRSHHHNLQNVEIPRRFGLGTLYTNGSTHSSLGRTQNIPWYRVH
jgi:hypothetical protein